MMTYGGADLAAAHWGTLQDRVRRAIAQDIETGKYAPGDRLPAEKELASKLGVSLAPVRAALDQLAQRSVIVRVQGKGTFVNDSRVQYRLESWRSCTVDLREQGIDFEVQVLTLEEAPVPEAIAKELGIAPGSPALHLARVIRIKGKSAIFLDSWTPMLSVSEAGDAADFEAGKSLYGAMAAKGAAVTSADTAIDINFSGENDSVIFDVPYATPLLQVTGVAYADKKVVEWSRLQYLGEMFSLKIRNHMRTEK